MVFAELCGTSNWNCSRAWVIVDGATWSADTSTNAPTIQIPPITSKCGSVSGWAGAITYTCVNDGSPGGGLFSAPNINVGETGCEVIKTNTGCDVRFHIRCPQRSGQITITASTSGLQGNSGGTCQA